MANYCCSTRTNYFHVKAPEQFKEFMARVYGTEDHVELWEEPDADGNPMFAFGTQGGIGGLRSVDADSEDEDDDDNNYDAFIEGLQGFIADDDAVIIQESGAEKLRYVLNNNTKKFHLPSCSSADDIKASNREDYYGSREDLIARGYDPCKRCNP